MFVNLKKKRKKLKFSFPREKKKAEGFMWEIGVCVRTGSLLRLVDWGALKRLGGLGGRGVGGETERF